MYMKGGAQTSGMIILNKLWKERDNSSMRHFSFMSAKNSPNKKSPEGIFWEDYFFFFPAFFFAGAFFAAAFFFAAMALS
jgi:hypothetical protein